LARFLDERKVDDLAGETPPSGLDVDDLAVERAGGHEGHADPAPEDGRKVAARELAQVDAVTGKPVTGPQGLAAGPDEPP
jgi:hypothetical protein